VLIDVLAELQIKLEERPFTPAEAKEAAEAFVTSASQIVMPVVAIDDATIGNGAPGTVSRRLREQFHRFSVFS
jgi:D-alanine transaminase